MHRYPAGPSKSRGGPILGTRAGQSEQGVRRQGRVIQTIAAPSWDWEGIKMLTERFARWAVFLALAAGALAISGEVLRGLDHWGRYDWDYHFFQGFSVYRSLLEFREPPLW